MTKPEQTACPVERMVVFMLTAHDLSFLKEHMPCIGHIGPADLRAVTEAGSVSECAAGEMLLSKGKECNGVVLAVRGQLRAYFESEDGKEITLYRLLPGDICILSASCVLKNITFEVTLEAEKPSAVCIIPAALWARLVERYGEVRTFSMELVNERFSEVMWVMEQMVSKNMGERVAAFLLEQSVLENTQSLTLTHEAIAKNLGTAREVVSRILKYLQGDGLLRVSRGRITLTDVKRLRQMSR